MATHGHFLHSLSKLINRSHASICLAIIPTACFASPPSDTFSFRFVLIHFKINLKSCAYKISNSLPLCFVSFVLYPVYLWKPMNTFLNITSDVLSYAYISCYFVSLFPVNIPPCCLSCRVWMLRSFSGIRHRNDWQNVLNPYLVIET